MQFKLTEGTFCRRNPYKTWKVPLYLELTYGDAVKNSNNTYSRPIKYKVFVTIPNNVTLGRWTDKKGSHLKFYLNDDNEPFAVDDSKMTLYQTTGLYNKSVCEGTISLTSNVNGIFPQITKVDWKWGVLPYQESAGTDYYTNGLYNESGTKTITGFIIPQVENVVPGEITISNIKATVDTTKYGNYFLDIIRTQSQGATRYRYFINDIEIEYPTPIRKSYKVKNGENIVKVIPYNGTVAGKAAYKDFTISWPTVHLKTKSATWSSGRPWIYIEGSWKLCEDVWVKIKDKDTDTDIWKKAERF